MTDLVVFQAFYHVCFALATAIGHSSDPQMGEACFKRARELIGNPMETVNFNLADVPALTLMAFYLIEVNRRDAAYSEALTICLFSNFVDCFQCT